MATEQSYWYAVGQFYTETKATQVGPSCSIDYKNWTLSEVQWTTHIDIKQQLALHRLGYFYNLYLIYMQVCETFLNKKWQTVMWHCECEQSIHVQQPRGLDHGGKVLVLASPRPRPRLFSQGQGQGQGLRCQSQGQGQDLHEVFSRILEAKARPRGQQDCIYAAYLWVTVKCSKYYQLYGTCLPCSPSAVNSRLYCLGCHTLSIDSFSTVSWQ